MKIYYNGNFIANSYANKLGLSFVRLESTQQTLDKSRMIILIIHEYVKYKIVEIPFYISCFGIVGM